MSIDNSAIARVLSEIADVCEIRAENTFKIRAYRNAAAAVESLPYEISSLAATPERLLEIKGIGSGIAARIRELVETGSSEEHRRLLAEFPAGLLEMLRVPGIGPKKTALFHAKLGVRSLDELEAAAREGRVRELPRMSEAAEAKLLQAIAAHRLRADRVLLATADETAARLLAMLEGLPGMRRAVAAGSLRRRQETVGDIDLLASCSDPGSVMAHFCRAGEVLAHGETKSSIRLSDGLQVDLRVVPEESFGAALHYFTGSKAHNIAVRTLGVRRGLTINEYGVFEAAPQGGAGARIGGASEEEVFRAVGLSFIPPEVREDRGEIEAAQHGSLPDLVARDDLRGDVHVHTSRTDGTATIAEMASAAAARGLAYLAITDHSKALAMLHGLDDAQALQHAADVARAQREFGDRIRIFTGIEVDILQDGDLDLTAETLAALDVVIGSVHSHFQLPKESMTRRLVRAIESGSIDILGHATGRHLLRRDPSAIDMEEVFRAAAANGVALEINSGPDRLDLSDQHCRRARELGVKLVINTDAHAPAQLDYLHFGIGNARRGWLTPADVLNTRGPGEFLSMLHDGHR